MSSKDVNIIHVPRPSAKINFAGFWVRFFAYLFDISITYLIVSFISPLFVLFIPGWTRFLSLILANILRLIYFVFFWFKYSATPGKMLFKLRIEKINNKKENIKNKLTFITAIIRYLSSYISGTILFLGYFWVAFDEKKQGWHDKIAKTIVVRLDNKNRTVMKILIIIFSIIEYLAIYLSIKRLPGPMTIKNVIFGLR